MEIAILLAACGLQLFCLYRLLLRVRDLERRVALLLDNDEALADAIATDQRPKGFVYIKQDYPHDVRY